MCKALRAHAFGSHQLAGHKSQATERLHRALQVRQRT